MSTIAELFVKLGLDSSEYEEGLNKADKKSSAFGSKVGKAIGSGLAGLGTAAVAGIAAVGAGLASTIGPASDLSETVSKVGVVFGDWSEDIIHFGDAAATALGMSKNAAMGAAGTYGNLFSAMGIGVEKNAEMSMGLVTLAGDLASFNNMDPTAVLDALRSGLSGETEPLKKLGVNLNQAGIEAKAMALGLWDGEGAISAAAKAEATYALVMEQTALAQGDFERTSSGLANQQRIMTANFENIKATIGTGLLPVVGGLVGGFNDLLGGIQGIVAGTGTMDQKMAGIGDLASKFIGGITEQLPAMLTAGVTMVTSLVSGLVQAIPMMIPGIVHLLMALVNGIITLMPILLEAGLQIILGLVLGIASALPTLIPSIVSVMLTMVMVLIENIPMLIEAAVQLIIGFVNGVIAALPIIIEQLPVIMEAVVTAILNALPLLWNAAIQIITALVTAINTNGPKLLEAGGEMVKILIQGIWTLIQPLVQAGAELVKKIAEGVKTRINEIKTAGVDLITGFWEGLKSKFDSIISGVGNFIGKIIAKLKSLLGISSPSKVMMGIGKNMMLGLEEGLTRFSGVSLDTTLNAVGGIPNTFNDQSKNEFATSRASYPSASEIGKAVALALMQTGAIG